jgi:uncharacterized RmlC-like cupin family protein
MGVRRIGAGERRPIPGTPGMVREEAVAAGGLWAGLVRTAPGMASGWHHHGDLESVIYVLSGELRMEFGPGGRQSVEAGAGDFLLVAPHAVHREHNPLQEEGQLVVVRVGTGEPVFDVDGPEPG